MASPLDNPVFAALSGPRAHLADRAGDAARYEADVAPFAGLADGAWDDLAAGAGPGQVVTLADQPDRAPAGWDVVMRIPGVQVVNDGVAGRYEPEAVPLTAADVPEMLDLVARTEPGPFRKR